MTGSSTAGTPELGDNVVYPVVQEVLGLDGAHLAQDREPADGSVEPELCSASTQSPRLPREL